MSPTRTRASWKPGVSSHPLPFFRCTECHAVLCAVDDAADLRIDRSLRREDATLPSPETRSPLRAADGSWSAWSRFPTANAPVLDRLRSGRRSRRERAARSMELDKRSSAALGRAQDVHRRAVEVRAAREKAAARIRVCRRGRAYAYCGKDPCRACTFRCKRGFHLYAYLDGLGLIDQAVHAETLRT